jgi:hypothetical protein
MFDLSFAGIRTYVDALANDVTDGKLEGYELVEQYTTANTVLVELEGHWGASPFREVSLTYVITDDVPVLMEYVVKGWSKL